MRLLNWNLEYAPPAGARGRAITEVIEGHGADVVCLTETHVSWPMDGGHWIWADSDYGYEHRGDRRKVGLWSRAPWTDVDAVGHLDLPGGRFVAGVTQTDIGEVTCLGVCIPWRAAHVSTGRGDRKPWQDHVTYLEILADVIREQSGSGRPVVVGDFNQRIPRRYTPKAVHDVLLATFAPLTIVTAGAVSGLEGGVIDHVALGPGLAANGVTGISRMVDGRRVSDHDGVVVDVRTA